MCCLLVAACCLQCAVDYSLSVLSFDGCCLLLVRCRCCWFIVGSLFKMCGVLFNVFGWCVCSLLVLLMLLVNGCRLLFVACCVLCVVC